MNEFYNPNAPDYKSLAKLFGKRILLEYLDGGSKPIKLNCVLVSLEDLLVLVKYGNKEKFIFLYRILSIEKNERMGGIQYE